LSSFLAGEGRGEREGDMDGAVESIGLDLFGSVPRFVGVWGLICDCDAWKIVECGLSYLRYVALWSAKLGA
jgi:hypothetical protein